MSDETKPDLPATAKEAPNTALDAVTDLALDSTIPAPIRRNAFKAFGQLCTAAIDWPVAYFEGKAAEIRAGTDARIKIIRENADQIAQQMQVDPEYARIAVSKYGQKILREQVNLDKISAIAADELKKTIAAEETNQSTGEPNKEGPAEATDNNEETTINDDWLNNFENEARQVSTEDMQRRFGWVLADEIKKPGSYSINTVKVLRALNRSAAVLFKRMCSMCIGFRDRPEPFRTVILPTACTDGRKGWRYSMEIWQLNILVEYGLIASRQEIWDPEYHSSIEKENSKNCYPFWYQGGYWGLRRLPGSKKKNAQMQVRGIPLSQAGRELFDLAEQEPMDSITEDFSKRHFGVLQEFFAEHNLRMAKVQLQKELSPDGKVIFYSVKWL
ncbi:MAG: DUF2806 domain-containing protein [Candidatus Poribacteria bacterium]|nr:DUF2806 domain-containing protein [Candidatus Poribacteria bacterium]